MPSPGAFTEVYERLAAEGATEILSIHLATSLSGMLNAARSGADATDGVKFTLFDSEQVSMGLGLLAISAAEMAAEGSPMEEIIVKLRHQVKRTYVFALLDTLEYLRRSGRVGWAQFGIGTLLRIKPMIKVYEGEVIMLDKVRTSKRALRQMLKTISELGRLDKAALLHIQGGENLKAFGHQAQSLFPGGQISEAVEVTPAIGAHVGPGALGIACIVAES